MGTPLYLSSLSCELRIIQAKNIEFKSSGGFFVRYYLSTENNKRVQLNSRLAISSKSNIIWNEVFSFGCLGPEESIDNLKKQTVVFELRWRNTVPVFGKVGKSQLVGRAEIPWKTVFESPNMEMETCVILVSKNSNVFELVSPPSLQIAMKVRVPAMVEIDKKRRNIA
ncbi:hypothetical protein CFOL_v3_26543 [Cephalotus follicularis]|uniref:C2 domain-containing protein n=1 Tax=Cephalotus follicularis TaxID=3775 RepID=A0A1Q3CSF2_CEPFO|nr:hypothetical protein CFOL_v3_26543 [Cephalotus follicularis]